MIGDILDGLTNPVSTTIITFVAISCHLRYYGIFSIFVELDCISTNIEFMVP